jgi:hypothetical protein
MRVCPICKEPLTLNNAAETRIKKGGYCRPCGARRNRDKRAQHECKQCGAHFKTGQGNHLFCSSECKSFYRKAHPRIRPDREEQRTRRQQEILRVAERRRLRSYSRAFYQKIFQPCICIDCGVEFETLHPAEWIALGFKNCGTRRCPKHRKDRWNSSHGGDYRRCRKFGVPYDHKVNRGFVLEQDNWTCYRCGIPTPKEKRGTYEPDAPEIDHVWALGEIRNGQKSPGHVKSNVRCICRKCNTEKNKEVAQREPGSHDAFHKERLKNLNGWSHKSNRNVETHIVCLYCQKPAVRQRENAKYCSLVCARKADNKRHRKHQIPEFLKCFCGATFKPKTFNQRFCPLHIGYSK